nr:hypothetical protein [Candidatus Sigynarchaeota archaeon]
MPWNYNSGNLLYKPRDPLSSASALSITGIMYRTGTGTYVGGMSFVVRVSYLNTGDLAVNSITTTLNFAGFTGLSANSSGIISVAAFGGTGSVDFLITIAAGVATNASVLIRATWAGTEPPSTPVSGGTGSSVPPALNVAIQSQASIAITGLVTAPLGPYVGGMSFTLMVTYSNTGGTSGVVDGTCNAQTYAGLSFSDPAPVTVNPGSTNTQAFTVIIAAGAMMNASVDIHVTWTGTEAISARAIFGDIPQDQILMSIQSQAYVAITNLAVAPPGPYSQGSSFSLTVTFSNTGGTAATVDATMDDGTYTDLTWSNPAAVIVVAGGTNTQVFTVNVGVSAAPNASVDIHVTWSGNEAISNRAISGDTPVDQILVGIQSQANVAITNLVITGPNGAGPYVAGMSFTLTVTFSNTGGLAATVDAMMDDGAYIGLSWTDPAAVIVIAGGTNTQVFTVTAAAGAATAFVTITVVWIGTEAITLRAISGDMPQDTIGVNMQAQASVTITNLVITGPNGAGPYVGGMSFTLTVTFSNTGGLAATVDAMMDDGAYIGLSWTDPAAVIVIAG